MKFPRAEVQQRERAWIRSFGNMGSANRRNSHQSCRKFGPEFRLRAPPTEMP